MLPSFLTTPGSWIKACLQHAITRYVVVPVGLLYLLCCLLAGYLADALLFHPRDDQYGDAVPVITIPTTGGDTLAAMLLENPSATYTILYSHGNAENLRDIAPRMEALRDLGFQVMAYDYRGYGQSTGTPSEKRCYDDIRAVYDYLTKTRRVPAQRIILYGRSLGGGPTVHLAARMPAAGLVLQSCFTSAFRLVGDHLPLLGDRFDNLHEIGNVRCPVLIIHGRADTVIPCRHGERLYAAAHTPKAALWIDDAGHNDLLEVAGDEYTTALTRFAGGLSHQ